MIAQEFDDWMEKKKECPECCTCHQGRDVRDIFSIFYQEYSAGETFFETLEDLAFHIYEIEKNLMLRTSK